MPNLFLQNEPIVSHLVHKTRHTSADFEGQLIENVRAGVGDGGLLGLGSLGRSRQVGR